MRCAESAQVQAGQEGVDQRDFHLRDEDPLEAALEGDDAAQQFGLEDGDDAAVVPFVQAVETEHGADEDADEDVHEDGEAVPADAGQGVAVFADEAGEEGFDFVKVFGEEVQDEGGQFLAVFRVFENRRQFAEHHPDALAAQQLEGAQ